MALIVARTYGSQALLFVPQGERGYKPSPLAGEGGV